MNRSKLLTIILIVFLMSLLSVPAAFGADVKGASVTVYNSGHALVKETRTVTLPKGLASVIFKDVPSTMDPTSVHAQAEGMTVRDVQYSYSPITVQNLLKRYIGKELTVIMPDPSDADARILRKATLVSMEEGPIFLVGNEVYVGNYDALLFPELPKDLHREPFLTLTTDNASAGKRDVLLSYLMSGLTWRADYTLALDASGEAGSLSTWATLENTSKRGFSAANLKLVAGEVAQVNAPRRYSMAKAEVMDAMVMEAPPAPSREEFAQFHVYSVGRPVTLSESGTCQISLFSSPAVKVKPVLNTAYHASGGQRSGVFEQNVNAKLLLENTEKNGLGQPMPGGRVRVFMPTKDGSQLLAGESNISHVATGSTVKLPLGRSFDVSVKRTQSMYKQLGKNSYECGWKIQVRNGSEKNQSLTLRETFSGQWKILNADHTYTKPDSGTMEFALIVPPTPEGKAVVIQYTVQVTH